MKELHPQNKNHIENKNGGKEIKNFPANSFWISIVSRM